MLTEVCIVAYRSDGFNTRRGVLFNKKLQPFYVQEAVHILSHTHLTCIRTKIIKVERFYSRFHSATFAHTKPISCVYPFNEKKERKIPRVNQAHT